MCSSSIPHPASLSLGPHTFPLRFSLNSNAGTFNSVRVYCLSSNLSLLPFFSPALALSLSLSCAALHEFSISWLIRAVLGVPGCLFNCVRGPQRVVRRQGSDPELHLPTLKTASTEETQRNGKERSERGREREKRGVRERDGGWGEGPR